MKSYFVFSSLLTSLALAPSALQQGPLPPTGPPGPTMKTLQQMEPRTLIPPNATLPFTISTAGSYYVTGSLSVGGGHAIIITTSNVTLNLSGFTISSTAAARTGSGILISGDSLTNISISNGNIRGTTTNSGATYSGGGFDSGISASATGGGEGPLGPSGVRVSDLSIAGIGNGILLNSATPSNVVNRTTVSVAAGPGIRAGVVSDSSASNTGGVAIEAQATSAVAGTRTTPGSPILPAPAIPLVRSDVDPRIAVPGGSSTATISAPGSHVLTGNIMVASGDGIKITADDVSLDLNGFTIASTAAIGSGNGINIDGRSRVSISNGHIRSGATYSGSFSNGPGFDSGINWPTFQPSSARVTGVIVTGLPALASTWAWMPRAWSKPVAFGSRGAWESAPAWFRIVPSRWADPPPSRQCAWQTRSVQGPMGWATE